LAVEIENQAPVTLSCISHSLTHTGWGKKYNPLAD